MKAMPDTIAAEKNIAPLFFRCWNIFSTPRLNKEPINKIKNAPVANNAGETFDTSTKSTTAAPFRIHRYELNYIVSGVNKQFDFRLIGRATPEANDQLILLNRRGARAGDDETRKPNRMLAVERQPGHL
jgi:hypothetical protein